MFVAAVGRLAVSIHAPTRGATLLRYAERPNLRFQSTHPRGVRLHDETESASQRRFNPRTHAGCDSPRGTEIVHERGFNPRTHAGCDSSRLFLPSIDGCFNPRTHAGCDKEFQTLLSEARAFQSTHPRGVRPALPAPVRTGHGFNPRTHAGCDGFIVNHLRHWTQMAFCANPSMGVDGRRCRRGLKCQRASAAVTYGLREPSLWKLAAVGSRSPQMGAFEKERSDDQRAFEIKARFGPIMLHPALPFLPEMIKPNGVEVDIDDVQ